MGEEEPKGLPRPLYIAGIVFHTVLFFVLLARLETWSEVAQWIGSTIIFLIMMAYLKGWLPWGKKTEDE